jgi:hypothetical protein
VLPVSVRSRQVAVCGGRRGTRLADYTFHERAADRRIVQPSDSTRRRDGGMMPAVKDRVVRRLSAALLALAFGGTTVKANCEARRPLT